MEEFEQIDMALGMLYGENRPNVGHHKLWIMGNSKSQLVKKMCLVEGIRI